MAIDFYRKKKGCKDVHLKTMSYTHFNLSRGYWMACYDMSYAREWLHFRKDDPSIIKCPDRVRPLFSVCDCDGRLLNRELKGIVKEIKSLAEFSDPTLLEKKYHRDSLFNDEILKNVCTLRRNDALALVTMFEEAAKNGGRLEWF